MDTRKDEHQDSNESNPLCKVGARQGGDLWDNSFLWACTTFFIILVLFMGLRVITSSVTWVREWDEWVLELVFSIVSQIGIMFAVPLISMWLYSRYKNKKQNYPVQIKQKQLFSSFGFNKPSLRVIGFAFILGALIYFFNVFVAGTFSGVLEMLGFRFPSSSGSTFPGVGGLCFSLVLIAILPGICEEVTHRGMLMKSFSAKLGVMRAILLSSILFGLMHLNIVQVFYATILGYIIAMAVIATRSLWVGIIMHFMNNALGTYFSVARNNGWFGGNWMSWFFDIFNGLGFIVFFAGIIGIYFAVMYIIHMFAKENFDKDKKLYLAKIIQANPRILITPNGEMMGFAELEKKLDESLKFMRRHQATRFYLDPEYAVRTKRGESFSITEKTIFYGIIFMGTLVTVFTLVWGLL